VNERIQALADQAEKYADTNFKGEPFWSEAYESKFAELIVRECANQVDWILAEGDKTQGDLIKEHFGVEE
jgi:hypothetical protein